MIRNQAETMRALESAIHEIELEGIAATAVDLARRAGVSRAVLYKPAYRPFLKRLETTAATKAVDSDQPPPGPATKKDPRVELAELKRLFGLHAAKAEVRELEYRDRIERLQAEIDRLTREARCLVPGIDGADRP